MLFRSVESLNSYFEKMVDVITDNQGIVDKYIGDAIMAFFGAPVKTDNDALASVKAGLGMMAALADFNKVQVQHQLTPFRIGIGINYGMVTVGNIGSNKKMDYTVIGDMVNLASRIEGLTKFYNEPILVSETVQSEIRGAYPSRLLDRVIVKGKSTIVPIYTLRETLNEIEKATWSIHEVALRKYTERNFEKSRELFNKILTAVPTDTTSKIYVQRCNEYIKTPPPESWQGEYLSLSK